MLRGTSSRLAIATAVLDPAGVPRLRQCFSSSLHGLAFGDGLGSNYLPLPLQHTHEAVPARSCSWLVCGRDTWHRWVGGTPPMARTLGDPWGSGNRRDRLHGPNHAHCSDDGRDGG